MKPLVTIMYGLLYPAVLGAIAYNLLPYLFNRFPKVVSERHTRLQVILGFFIALHFIADFAFIQEFSHDYGWLQFFLDLAVVFSLYNAFWALRLDGNQVKESEILPRRLAGWMACVYLAFLLWSEIERSQSTFVEHWPVLLAITATAFITFTVLTLRPRIWIITAAIFFFGVIETISSFKLLTLASQ